MAVKVAINGFGRIGRNVLRAIIESGWFSRTSFRYRCLISSTDAEEANPRTV